MLIITKHPNGNWIFIKVSKKGKTMSVRDGEDSDIIGEDIDIVSPVTDGQAKSVETQVESENNESVMSRFQGGFSQFSQTAKDFFADNEEVIQKNKIYIISIPVVLLIVIVGYCFVSSGTAYRKQRAHDFKRSDSVSISAQNTHGANQTINPDKFNNQFALKKSINVRKQVEQLQDEQNSMSRMMTQLSNTQVTLAKQTEKIASEMAYLKKINSENPEVIQNLKKSMVQVRSLQSQYNKKIQALSLSQSEVSNKLSEVIQATPKKAILAKGWKVSAATNQAFFLTSPSGELHVYRIGQPISGLGQLKGPVRMTDERTGEKQEVLLVGNKYIPFPTSVIS